VTLSFSESWDRLIFSHKGPPWLQLGGAEVSDRCEAGSFLDDGGCRREKDRMTYRELTMIEIREVLRRWQAGQGIREIAREGCVDRKTARRYVQAAEQCALPREVALNDEQVNEVAKRVQSRPVASPSAEHELLLVHRGRIEKWLACEPPLRMSKIHRLLEREGYGVSYATLRRFITRELGLRKRPPTVRVDDAEPGQEAQVDFGRMGRMYDPVAGRVRTLWALIVTLNYSRYAFVWPTFFTAH